MHGYNVTIVVVCSLGTGCALVMRILLHIFPPVFFFFATPYVNMPRLSVRQLRWWNTHLCFSFAGEMGDGGCMC